MIYIVSRWNSCDTRLSEVLVHCNSSAWRECDLRLMTDKESLDMGGIPAAGWHLSRGSTVSLIGSVSSGRSLAVMSLSSPSDGLNSPSRRFESWHTTHTHTHKTQKSENMKHEEQLRTERECVERSEHCDWLSLCSADVIAGKHLIGCFSPVRRR